MNFLILLLNTEIVAKQNKSYYLTFFEGVCKCSEKYVGTDCSHEKSSPPSNLTLPEKGLCKTSKRPCAKTNIFGYFVTQTVFAILDEFQVNHRYDSTNKSRFSYLSNINCYNLFTEAVVIFSSLINRYLSTCNCIYWRFIKLQMSLRISKYLDIFYNC